MTDIKTEIDKFYKWAKISPKELLSDPIWNFQFYTHIYLGGIALIIGWTQFVKQLRTKNTGLDMTIGKIYILSVLISGIAGL